MPEVHLKKKVTLRQKGESAAFTFEGKLKVVLSWETQTDMDLCIFFKKKDGGVGGVFSDGYRNNKADLGSLDKFPFMQHMGDERDADSDKESSEIVKVANLDDIDTAYICVVNYGAATEGRNVTFSDEKADVEVRCEEQSIEVVADSSDPGQVYLVCSIKNNGDSKSVVNEKRVLDLSGALDQIPGFSLITE